MVYNRRLRWVLIRTSSRSIWAIADRLLMIRWNRFACSINETLIRQTALEMKNSGFLDAGYKYINLDDCWNTKGRDANGQLVVDLAKFPSELVSRFMCVPLTVFQSPGGMKNLTDFLHGLGFKAGVLYPFTQCLIYAYWHFFARIDLCEWPCEARLCVYLKRCQEDQGSTTVSEENNENPHPLTYPISVPVSLEVWTMSWLMPASSRIGVFNIFFLLPAFPDEYFLQGFDYVKVEDTFFFSLTIEYWQPLRLITATQEILQEPMLNASKDGRPPWPKFNRRPGKCSCIPL